MTRLAPHEALELHELMRAETLGATKVKAMLPMVGDADLRAHMERCLEAKQTRLTRMRQFAENAIH
ncbi:MAG: hypothetical protein ACOY94_03390 [Bacillota bacterium]